MPARTVKGPEFTIIVGEKQIIVKHIYSKGKRCRVTAPDGVVIESTRKNTRSRGLHERGLDSKQTLGDVD